MESSASKEPEQWIMKGYVLGSKVSNEIGSGSIIMPEVIRLDNNTYRMYYRSGDDSQGYAIKYAESRDGIIWDVKGVALQGASNPNDREFEVSGPRIIHLPDGRYRMYYQSNPQYTPPEIPKFSMRCAISTDGAHFTKEGIVTDIYPYDPNSPFSLVGHGAYFIASNGLYIGFFSGNAKESKNPSSLYFTTSTNGLNFSNFTLKYPLWHDPTVIKTDEGYRLYATYDLNKQGTAFSLDGIHWPAELTEIKLVDSSGTHLTPQNSGVGDLGAVLLFNGTIRIYTNYGRPVKDFVYFEKKN